MSERDSNAEISIEDVRFPAHVEMSCGEFGAGVFPPNLVEAVQFKAPPPDSPAAGRLVLVTSSRGGIQVKQQIDLTQHRVELSIGGNENQLLIRIPVGVRLFRVHVDGGFFLYYETSEGHNVVPVYIKNGTDQGQKMQELVLAVSPVPPRDPNLATQEMKFTDLTPRELDFRRSQVGLPPIFVCE